MCLVRQTWLATGYPIAGLLAYVIFAVVALAFWTGAIGVKFERK